MSVKVTIDGYKDVWHFTFATGPHSKERVGGNHQTKIRTRNYETVIAAAAADQIEGTKFQRLSGRLAVEIYFKAKRLRGDIDNYAKSLLDALNRIVWEDDRQIDTLILHREPCVDTPWERTDVFVYELE